MNIRLISSYGRLELINNCHLKARYANDWLRN